MTAPAPPGTIKALFNQSLQAKDPEMKPWIKRTLFGLFGAGAYCIGGLARPAAIGTHGHGWQAMRDAEHGAS
jgi:hypothetical protein